MSVKAISQPRFDALCFMRHPNSQIIGEEREWYSDENENVFGVLIFDRLDKDWLYIVLGRDEVARFRYIDSEINYRTDADARTALHRKMEEYSLSGQKVFPQSIERKDKTTFLIFKPIADPDKLDPSFVVLSESKGFSPAREIIKEIAYTFEDPDGTYIQQFQTMGFDARLWELYLYAALHELEFVIDRTYKAPDYVCFSLGQKVIIEATTANSPESKSAVVSELKGREMEDFIAITLGSPLYSKLQKRYWEQEHVKGNPLVFALADFRRTRDIGYCAPYLMHYLYGLRQHEKNGVITYTPIDEHTFGGKKIPSGFFNLPDAENVSAVLFSDSGTISKFNRMGKIAGFGNPTVTMARVGERYPHRDSEVPEPFSVLIEGSYREAWAEGIWIFHNPITKFPVKRELFPDVAHVYLENGGFNVYLSDAFPTWSKTHIFSSDDDMRRFSAEAQKR